MAVLAVLPTASVAVSAASVSASAADIDSVVQQLINTYNASAAEGAKIWITGVSCGTADQNLTVENYTDKNNVTLGSITTLSDALSKESDALGRIVKYLGRYLDQTELTLFGTSISVDQSTATKKFEGELTSSQVISGTEIKYQIETDTNGSKKLSDVLETSGVLAGSSYFLEISGTKDIECKDVYTGKVTGTVNVDYSYVFGKGALTNQNFEIGDQT